MADMTVTKHPVGISKSIFQMWKVVSISVCHYAHRSSSTVVFSLSAVKQH